LQSYRYDRGWAIVDDAKYAAKIEGFRMGFFDLQLIEKA
jgi:hypothetical protein